MGKRTLLSKRFLYSFFAILVLITISSIETVQYHTLSGRKISEDVLDKFLIGKMDALQMPGLSFALINNGKVVYSRSLGIGNLETKSSVNQQSIFEAASLSKPLFAYFTLKMVERGLLALDTPLYKYLPYKDIEVDERYKLITARMVLSHQSGFPNWRYFDKRDEKLHRYGELYLKFTPGTMFSYSGEGYFYLSKVLAYLNGLDIATLDALFQKDVAKPLGLTNSWFSGNNYITQHKVSGYSKGKKVEKKWPTSFPDQDSTWFGAAGGLHTNAEDYSRFLIALMKEKGLSKKKFKELFKEQVKLPPDAPQKNDGEAAWALGMAIMPVSYGNLYAHGGNNGGFQSGFVINKENASGYVFFTNCDQGAAFNKKLKLLLTSK